MKDDFDFDDDSGMDFGEDDFDMEGGGGDREPTVSNIKSDFKDAFNEDKEMGAAFHVDEVLSSINESAGTTTTREINDTYSEIESSIGDAKEKSKNMVGEFLDEIPTNNKTIASAVDSARDFLGIEKKGEDGPSGPSELDTFMEDFSQSQSESLDIQAKISELTNGTLEANTKAIISALLDSDTIKIKDMNATAKYRRQTMELSFRHYLEARGTKELLAKILGHVDTQLSAISNNTALPDLVKVRGSEALVANLRSETTRALFQRMIDANGPLANFKRNTKNLINSATDTVEGMLSLAGGATGILDQGSFGKIAYEGSSSYAKGLLGRTIGNKLKDTKVGKFVSDKITTYMKDPASYIEKYKDDRFLGKPATFLANMFKNEENQNTELAMTGGLDMATSFDGKTKLAITDVIPQILSRILARVTKLSTGIDTSPQTYDYSNRRFVDNKDKEGLIKNNVSQLIQGIGDDAKINDLFKVMETNSGITLTDAEKEVLAKAFNEKSRNGDYINVRNVKDDDDIFSDQDEATREKLKNALHNTQFNMKKGVLQTKDKNSNEINDALKSLTNNIEITGFIEDKINNGYADTLVDMGLISVDSRQNRYIINHDKVQVYIDDIYNKSFLEYNEEDILLTGRESKRLRMHKEAQAKAKEKAKRKEEGKEEETYDTDILGDAFSTAKGKAKDAKDSAVKASKDIYADAKEVKNLEDAKNLANNRVLNPITGLYEELSADPDSALNKAKATVEDAVEQAKGYVEGTAEALGKHAENVKQVVEDHTPEAVKKFAEEQSLKAKTFAEEQALKAKETELYKSGETKLEEIQKAVADVKESVKENGIKKTAEQLAQDAKDSELGKTVEAKLKIIKESETSNKVTSAYKQTMESEAVKAINNAVETLKEDGVADTLSNAYDAVKDIDAKKKVTDLYETGRDSETGKMVTGKLKSAGQYVGNLYGDMKNKMSNNPSQYVNATSPFNIGNLKDGTNFRTNLDIVKNKPNIPLHIEADTEDDLKDITTKKAMSLATRFSVPISTVLQFVTDGVSMKQLPKLLGVFNKELTNKDDKVRKNSWMDLVTKGKKVKELFGKKDKDGDKKKSGFGLMSLIKGFGSIPGGAMASMLLMGVGKLLTTIVGGPLLGITSFLTKGLLGGLGDLITGKFGGFFKTFNGLATGLAKVLGLGSLGGLLEGFGKGASNKLKSAKSLGGKALKAITASGVASTASKLANVTGKVTTAGKSMLGKIASKLPFLAGASALHDAYGEVQEGNYGKAMLSTLMGVASFIPATAAIATVGMAGKALYDFLGTDKVYKDKHRGSQNENLEHEQTEGAEGRSSRRGNAHVDTTQSSSSNGRNRRRGGGSRFNPDNMLKDYNEGEAFVVSRNGVQLKFTISRVDKILLEAIAAHESKRGSSGYKVTYSYGKYVPKGVDITKLSIRQIYKLMDIQVRNTQHLANPTSAMGKYQFIQKTLREMVTLSKISEDTIFNSATQDFLILTRLRHTRKYDSWKLDKITNKQFVNKLSMEFASIQDPYKANGMGHYKGQRARNTTKILYPILDKMKQMLKGGSASMPFSPKSKLDTTFNGMTSTESSPATASNAPQGNQSAMDAIKGIAGIAAEVGASGMSGLMSMVPDVAEIQKSTSTEDIPVDKAMLMTEAKTEKIAHESNITLSDMNKTLKQMLMVSIKQYDEAVKGQNIHIENKIEGGTATVAETKVNTKVDKPLPPFVEPTSYSTANSNL